MAANYFANETGSSYLMKSYSDLLSTSFEDFSLRGRVSNAHALLLEDSLLVNSSYLLHKDFETL